MTRKLRIYCFIIFNIIFVSFFPKIAFAQVVINEFSSSTTNDWVEVYNTGSPIDISSLALVDGDGNQKDFPSCILGTNGTYAVDWSNRLDNGGDRMGLLKDGRLVDCVSYKSGPACEGKVIDFPDLGDNEFGVRQPEGTGSWVKETTATKSDNSLCAVLALTPTEPTTSPSILTPTPTPKATYKINKAKDNNGVELSSVKIYVDGQYTHHYDDETLTFCDGCHCDDENAVDCGFGGHVIKTEKDGYENWQETKTFSAGDSYEVNPVMGIVSSSTPTPTVTSAPTSTPTPKASLTPTKKPTPSLTLTPTPTPSGEILGQEASESALDQLSDEDNKATPSSEGSGNIKKIIFPAVAIIVGIGFIGFSVFSFLKGRRQKEEPEEVVV